MEDTKNAQLELVSVNDAVALVAMEMVIEGYKKKDGVEIDRAIRIMQTFKDAPLIDIERKTFIEKFGE